MSDAKVVPFRKRALTPPAALKYLRDLSTDGLFETESYSTLATLLGWNRSQAWKAVARWQKSGKLVVESGADDARLVLRIPPDRRALVRGKGAGVAAPKRGIGKRKKAAGGVPTGGPESVPAGTLETPPPDLHEGASLVARSNDNSKTYANHEIFSNAPEAPFEKPVEATPVSVGNTTVYAEVAERFPPVSTEPHRVEPTPHLPTDGRVVARPKGGGGDGPGFDAIDAFSRASFAEKVFLLAALGLSGTAAYISVEYGMSVLYMAGAPVILVLGGFIELAKFAGVSVVSSGWSRYSFFSKWAMAFLLFLAAVVNAAAVYGWLIASHAGPAASRTATYTQQDAGQGASIEAAQARLADYDKQIAQIDDAIAAATKRGRTRDALRIVDQQKRNRATLVAARDKEQQALGSLRTGRSTTVASRQVDEANNMPIRYGALLFEDIGLLAPGTDPEKLIRWLSAMILMCGDPMALAGMWMISSRMRRRGGAS
jgi:hypothetical protein